MSWSNYYNRAGDILHVIPRNDLVKHETNENCVCLPSVEIVHRDGKSDGHLYKHSALDGRKN